MKKLVTALVLGTLVTSCSMDSDPTKDTKHNFKNALETQVKEKNIQQKSAGQCNKLLNIQIDKSYTIEPGTELSDILVAHSLLQGLDIELKLLNSDKNPPGLKLVKVPGEVGEYQFKLDTSKIQTKKNYETYYVDLVFTKKGQDNLPLTDCAASNQRTIKLVYIAKTKQIPVKVADQELSDEGIVELQHDLNASNTFKVKLPAKSGITIYPLSQNIDSIDIQDYATYTHNNKGTFTITIDNEALAEKFKGQEEQDLALSMTAFSGGAYEEDFNVHFKFISNKKIEEPAEVAEDAQDADIAEGI